MTALSHIFHRVCQWKNYENPLKMDKVSELKFLEHSPENLLKLMILRLINSPSIETILFLSYLRSCANNIVQHFCKCFSVKHFCECYRRGDMEKMFRTILVWMFFLYFTFNHGISLFALCFYCIVYSNVFICLSGEWLSLWCYWRGRWSQSSQANRQSVLRSSYDRL